MIPVVSLTKEFTRAFHGFQEKVEKCRFGLDMAGKRARMPVMNITVSEFSGRPELGCLAMVAETQAERLQLDALLVSCEKAGISTHAWSNCKGEGVSVFLKKANPSP